MDKEKEIEELARAMCEHFEPCMQGKPCTACKTYERNCYTIHKARLLVNAGYGNVKQAVKEFAEKIKDWLHGADLYFYNGQEEFILDGEEVDDKIDEFLKELCGEGDNES